MWNENTKAVTANSEAVATWEAEKLEPLRKEVMMLRDELEPLEYIYHTGSSTQIRIAEALLTTQATAEAYERELVDNFIGSLRGIPSIGLSERQFGELHAANKGKEIV